MGLEFEFKIGFRFGFRVEGSVFWVFCQTCLEDLVLGLQDRGVDLKGRRTCNMHTLLSVALRIYVSTSHLLKYSLLRDVKAEVYTVWAHEPLG